MEGCRAVGDFALNVGGIVGPDLGGGVANVGGIDEATVVLVLVGFGCVDSRVFGRDWTRCGSCRLPTHPPPNPPVGTGENAISPAIWVQIMQPGYVLRIASMPRLPLALFPEYASRTKCSWTRPIPHHPEIPLPNPVGFGNAA